MDSRDFIPAGLAQLKRDIIHPRSSVGIRRPPRLASAFRLESTQPGLEKLPQKTGRGLPGKIYAQQRWTGDEQVLGKGRRHRGIQTSSLVHPHSFDGRFGKGPPGALLAWGPSKWATSPLTRAPWNRAAPHWLISSLLHGRIRTSGTCHAGLLLSPILDLCLNLFLNYYFF